MLSPDPRTPFVDFLAEFWQATGKDDLTTEQLKLLQKSAAKLDVSDVLPQADAREAYGAYSPALRAVWLNTAAVLEWLTPRNWEPVTRENARRRYSDSKGHVSARLEKFVRAGMEQFWSARQNRYFGVPNGSVLLHADFGHVLWFGARTEGEIRTTIERNNTLFRDRARGKARFDQLLHTLTTADRHFIITQQLVAQKEHEKQVGESKKVTIRALPDVDPPRVAAQFNNIELPAEPTFIEVSEQEKPRWRADVDAPQLASAADTFDEFDLLVLQAIAGIEGLGLSPAPKYLIELIIATLGPPMGAEARVWKLRETLLRLEAKGWVEEPIDLMKFDGAFWRFKRHHVDIGWLDLVPLFLRKKDEIKPDDLRNVLGMPALKAWSYDEKYVVAIADAVTPMLSNDEPVLLTYAEALARAGEPDRALVLLERFSGDAVLTRNVRWLIASGLLRTSLQKFTAIAATLDDGQLRDLVRHKGWSIRREQFEQLAWKGGIHRPEHLPTIERLASAIDDVYPDEHAVERLRAWREEAGIGRAER